MREGPFKDLLLKQGILFLPGVQSLATDIDQMHWPNEHSMFLLTI